MRVLSILVCGDSSWLDGNSQVIIEVCQLQAQPVVGLVAHCLAALHLQLLPRRDRLLITALRHRTIHPDQLTPRCFLRGGLSGDQLMIKSENHREQWSHAVVCADTRSN